MRVVSWNIQGERELWSRGHTARLAEALAVLDADIIALQEVHRRSWKVRGIDQFERVRDRLGMRGVFGATMGRSGGAYGLAILSRWPFGGVARAVPLGGAGEPRIALVAPVETPAGEVKVIATHLAAWGWIHRRARQIQVRELISMVTAGSRSILAGDLNAHPESAELLPLRSCGYLESCFEEHPITHPFSGGSLDAILVTPSLRVTSAACGVERISDHVPLIVEVDG